MCRLREVGDRVHRGSWVDSSGMRQGWSNDLCTSVVCSELLLHAILAHRFVGSILSPPWEVSTLHFRGVDPAAIETYGVTPDGRMMFLIFSSPFRIFTAETTDSLESTFCSDMQRVDWTGARGARANVELIAGKDRRVFRADGRILEARAGAREGSGGAMGPGSSGERGSRVGVAGRWACAGRASRSFSQHTKPLAAALVRRSAQMASAAPQRSETEQRDPLRWRSTETHLARGIASRTQRRTPRTRDRSAQRPPPQPM